MTDDKVQTSSTNPLEERIEQLKQLFPEAVTEDGINFDTLRNLLGIEFPQKERYNFTWAGKQEALLSLQRKSKATLKPVPEESVNWETTQHLFIEADNLEALKLLYKSYFGQVKMIYIDPPYNTGNDFVYPDDYADPIGTYLRVTGQTDENGNTLTSRQEVNGRRHSTWLSMMYPRLFLARQLLRDDGVIFVSIDDNEVHHLRLLLDQIFGAENFIAQIVAQTNPRGRSLDKFLAKTFEYVLVYGKFATASGIHQIEKDADALSDYKLQDEKGQYRELELRNRNPVFNRKNRPKLYFPIYIDPNSGKVHLEQNSIYTEVALPINSKNEDGCWTWSPKKINANPDLLVARYVSTGVWRVFRKDYLTPEGEAFTKEKALWLDKEINHENGKEELGRLFGTAPFDFPKSVSYIKKVLNISTSSDENDLILDFFAGSCTTAQAVLELNREDGGNRQFIMVQLPEPTANPEFPTIAEIGKERIRRVIARMQTEENGKLNGFEKHPDEDLGFRVFKQSESSIRQWEELPSATTTAEEYARQMELFVKEPLLPNWTEEGLITEVALKEMGFSLSFKVELVPQVTEQTVYRVTDEEKGQWFYICLDNQLSLEALKPLKLQRDDLFIFRDTAATDTIQSNLVLWSRIKKI